MRTYKVITYNIHGGRNLWMLPQLDRVILFLRNEQPDIISIQEINEGKRRGFQVSKISKELNFNVHFGSHISLDGGQYGIATYTRSTILSRKHILLPHKRENRGLLDTLIKQDGEIIHVLNTHLSLNSFTRINQLKKIQTYLRTLQTPFIFMGDLNTSLSTLDELDVAKLMNKEHLPTTMFSNKRIDYIYVSKDIKIVDYRVLPLKLSDHFPVVAEFTFNN